MTGIAQVAFHDRANGSLVKVDGKVVGSSLIGQNFVLKDGSPDPRYFQPRPSAAGDGYDALSSGGTNNGPSNANLIGNVPGRGDRSVDGQAAEVEPVRHAERPVLRPGAGHRQGRQPDRRPGRERGVREEPRRHVRVRPEHGSPTRAGVPQAQRAPADDEGAGRRGDGIGLGPRPRHLRRERAAAGRTRVARARRASGRRKCSTSSISTPTSGSSASSARRP